MAVNLTTRFLVDGWERLQFALLPPHCLLCGQLGSAHRDLCAACAADLVRNVICCPRCALPLATPAPLCGECLQHAPPFAAAYVPFVYAAPLDQLVTSLKFGRSLAAGRVLAELWIDALRGTPALLPQALIPVPLHPQRLRERGYNQALELARPIAQTLGIALREDVLARTRATPAQSHLDAVERQRNLRGAFAVVDGLEVPDHVAVIDDVMTTGATLRECARALLHVGVSRVDVWALARAPKPR